MLRQKENCGDFMIVKEKNFAPTNVEYFKAKIGIKSNEKLADRIGFAASTLKSYLANPNSNSRVREPLANLFGISVDALENIDFASLEIKADSKENIDIITSDDVSSADIDTYTKIKSNLKFEELKDAIVEKYDIKIKSDLAKFSIAIRKNDYETALCVFSLILFSYTDNELLRIDNVDLQKYIELCISSKHKDYLNALAKRYLSFETRDINKCITIANALENCYDEISEHIYNSLLT